MFLSFRLTLASPLKVTAMLNSFDKDKDGKVTFAEYMDTLCPEGWLVEDE